MTWCKPLELQMLLPNMTAILKVFAILVMLCAFSNGCTQSLGMEDRRIADRQISASSQWDSNNGASNARLNLRATGKKTGAWVARVNDVNQWLRVDFGSPMKVTGIDTQGRQDCCDQWVTSYTVSYSLDNIHYANYQQNGQIKLFTGNTDRQSIVHQQLWPSITARYIRIHPRTWKNHISMRAEFRGCAVAVCGSPLGVEDRRISDLQLSASSEWSSYNSATNARLNFRVTTRKTGAWSAMINDVNQWLRVDFGSPMKVTGIDTQGRQDCCDQWVTSYTVSYSLDNIHYANYQQIGQVKVGLNVFAGNADRNSIVHQTLWPPITARYIRIHPRTWNNHISMRVEFRGCAASRCTSTIGMEDKRISDSQVSASSEWSSNHAAINARMNFQAVGQKTGAWSARTSDRNQWLKVDFGSPMKVTGIDTQGRQDCCDQWVTSYTVSYSQDNIHYANYQQNGQIKLFTANADRHSIAHQNLWPPITARFIRIHPNTWNNFISMRAEFHGCAASACDTPLGMEDKRISDRQISASSERSTYNTATNARMNFHVTTQKTGGWSARTNDVNQWLRVDFGSPMKVTGIDTQGRQDCCDQWVTSYTVSYSQDNIHYANYQQNGQVKVFTGNSDRNSIVHQNLWPPVTARYIRIHPKTWKNHISMRAEFRGCAASGCGSAIGMEDKRISDRQVSASSEWSSDHAATNARMNFQAAGRKTGAWSAKTSDRNQWLRVDFGSPMKVTGIDTQGRQDCCDQWVTSYTVSYSQDNIHYANYQQNGQIKVFSGNSDRHSIVHQKLLPSVTARYIRIHPRTWKNHISMRFELRGCAAPACGIPLGMEDKRISDRQISASSEMSTFNTATNARLNFHVTAQKTGGWSARTNDVNQWLRVDFGSPMKLTGIDTQGRQDCCDQWVTSYTVSYSSNSIIYTNYQQQNGQIKVFAGNADRNSIVHHVLWPTLTARFIRIHPRTWKNHISMRAEFYGCTAPQHDCNNSTRARQRRCVAHSGICGTVVSRSTRIVGGSVASVSKWPWLVMLRSNDGLLFCGGALVNNLWIATAAHCVIHRLPSMFHARLGAHFRVNGVIGTEQDMLIAKRIAHPQYTTPRRFSNDIALLKLATPAVFTSGVRPVCLPDQRIPLQLNGQKSCWIAGWGTMGPGTSAPNILLEASLPLVPMQKCNRVYPSDIDRSMFCAGFDRGGVDGCQGDSGGPIMCEYNNRWYLDGVSSWGSGCGRANLYGVYSNVRFLHQWIVQTINSN